VGARLAEAREKIVEPWKNIAIEKEVEYEKTNKIRINIDGSLPVVFMCIDGRY
jgi:hypothetical protein